MSKPLKYRVWSETYGRYIGREWGAGGDDHHMALRRDGKLYYAEVSIKYPGTWSEAPILEWNGSQYDDCVVEQYTGIDDKDGMPIYEGDIVEEEVFGSVTQYVVKWDESCLCWRVDPIIGANHRDQLFELNSTRKIIGSIHDKGKR